MHKKLGEVLKELGYITEEHIKIAVEIQKIYKVPLGQILVELSFVSPRELAEALAIQAQKEYIDLSLYKPSLGVLKIVDKRLAERYEFIPLEIKGNKVLIAVSDPYNTEAINKVTSITGLKAEVYVSDRESILKAIQVYYEELTQPLEQKVENLIKRARADESAVRDLVDAIIRYAIINRATDIHFSPESIASHIFLRIDGVLHHAFAYPKQIHQAVATRIKVISGLDISQQRIPQDGSFSFKFMGTNYDVRVATGPTVHGENIVLRLLPKDLSLFNLKYLGFEEDTVRALERIVSQPYGMFVITGPTGSGKTTTLYASLRRIDFLKKNVLTVEDPVEYRFPFIKQTQVNEKAGYTFAKAIRSFLRQDPDVILVGEIRDTETAEMAVRASITGHLLLSTVHANDSVSVIPRLIDLGIKPYMVASSLKAVLSQRLVRKICPFCKMEYEEDIEKLGDYGFDEEILKKYVTEKKVKLFKGKGCERCNGTGYLGRNVVAELLIVDDEIEDMIVNDKPPYMIMKKAIERGMRPIREDALIKILKGVTTPEEVYRVLG